MTRRVPSARRFQRVRNAAAVAYATGAVILASRLGELAPFLAIVTVLVVAAVGELWWIHATLPARYARQIGRPDPRKALPSASTQPAPVLTGRTPTGVTS